MMFQKIHNFFQYDTKNHEWSQIWAVFVVSMSGFNTITLIAWPSPSIPILTSNLSDIAVITDEEASYFSVIPGLATFFLAPVIALLSDYIGRKYLIILLTVPQIISWSIVHTARNLTDLYISRAISGISDAIIFCVIPIYVGEICTPKVRGQWGILFMILLFLGQFLINVVGSYCAIKTTALVFITFPIIQCIFALFIPESPYYLIVKSRNAEAERSLKWLRWNRLVEEELDQLIKDVKRQISERGTFKDVFVISTNRRALLICLAMRGFQMWSGLMAFATYTQQMFALQNTSQSSKISAMIYTGILFITALSYLLVMQKLGRRKLMLFSTIGTTTALFIETVYLYLEFEINFELTSVNWIPLTTMIFYIVFMVGGLGILPSLMVGELFSSSVKGKAIGIVNVFYCLCALIIPKVFQYLTANFSSEQTASNSPGSLLLLFVNDELVKGQK
ncbi:hypothetical protein FQR65_LT09448 [Abscondita terminalis]|nr:hypothetical protein FQR65_LT09448 [Abscondita terminalis]